MAIAFDATAKGIATGATSLTFAHTVSGVDRFLAIGFANFSTTTVSSVTFNGDACSSVDFVQLQANAQVHMYSQTNPDTGTNNIVITVSGSTTIRGVSASYTGVSQTGQPDADNKVGPAPTGSPSVAVTTTVDNSWAVAIAYGGSGINPGTNWTARNEDALGRMLIGDSGAAITPAGSYTMGVQDNPADNAGIVIASFAPAATTTIKTWDGIARANVKTLLGVASANIKTINGIS